MKLSIGRLMAGTLAGLAFAVPTAWAGVLPYDDSSTYKDHFEAVQKTTEWGIFDGYPDSTFRGYNEMNRAELAKILVRANGLSDADIAAAVDSYLAAGNNSFLDIDATKSPNELWYVDYVLYAKSVGWVNGYPDRTFRPGDPVNIVEATKMITEALFKTPSSAWEGDDWYDRYLDMLDYFDILELTESEHLTYTFTDRPIGFDAVPQSKVTRRDVAELVYRIKTALDAGEGNFTKYNPVLTLDEYSTLYGVTIEEDEDDGLLRIDDGAFSFEVQNLPLGTFATDNLSVYIEHPSGVDNGYLTTLRFFDKFTQGEFFSVRVADADYNFGYYADFSDVDCWLYAHTVYAEPQCNSWIDDEVIFTDYTKPLKFTKYTDSDLRFTLDYPVDWEVHTYNGTFEISSDDEDILSTINITVDNLESDVALEDYSKTLLGDIESGDFEYELIESGTRDLGLYEGYYLLGDYSVFGVNLSLLSLYTIQDNTAYIVHYAYDEATATFYADEIERILKSFELLYETEESDTTDYLTFTDETYVLSMDYPENWDLDFRDEDDETVIATFETLYEDGADAYLEIVTLRVEDGSQTTLTDYSTTILENFGFTLSEAGDWISDQYTILAQGLQKFGEYDGEYTLLSRLIDQEEFYTYILYTIQEGRLYLFEYYYEAAKTDLYADQIDHMIDSFLLDIDIGLSTTDYNNSTIKFLNNMSTEMDDTVAAYNEAVPNIVTPDDEIETGGMESALEAAQTQFDASDAAFAYESEDDFQQRTFREWFEDYLNLVENYLEAYEAMIAYYAALDNADHLSLAAEHDSALNEQYNDLLEFEEDMREELANAIPQEEEIEPAYTQWESYD